MTSTQSIDSGTEREETTTVDAIVVGAGFAGLYMVHRLARMGLDIKAFEMGADVGGTWFWNRYPGARTDSEASFYSYSFSPELDTEWDWTEKFPTQPEVQRYLAHVADRFELRQYFTFNTSVTAAVYDEEAKLWRVTTSDNQRHTTRFLITAAGLLSAPIWPDFGGLENFQGRWVHSARWPREGVDLKGKRVALIGTGSSGVQLIPQIVDDVDELLVFQRTPNYVVPARHKSLTDADREEIRGQLDRIRELNRSTPFAFPYPLTGRLALDYDEEKRNAIYEEVWERGGLRFMMETFDDIGVDIDANYTAAEFIRGKIRELVKDPKTAELLSPTYPFTLKRPPTGNGFYEAFNRENVHIIDVREAPITGITSNGVRTENGHYEVDVIILATGFDVGTGAITRIDLRGRNGLSIRDKWSDGPKTFMGLSVRDFPNYFMIGGPHYGAGNIPTVVEEAADWISAVIDYARKGSHKSVEPSEDAERGWMEHVEEVTQATFFPKYGKEANSYNYGANVEGKPAAVIPYYGGTNIYFDRCDAEIESGFPSFRFE
jgi:cyclohexanone monooxygenase